MGAPLLHPKTIAKGVFCLDPLYFHIVCFRFCYQMDRFLMHVPSFCDELEPMEDPNVAIGEAFHAIDEEED